jgi:hypothetical protein
MFARGLVSLHTAPLLGQKPYSVKSCVSITSKLIQIKGLQLHYFGHLRKTGGRGMPAMPISSLLELTEVEESFLPTPLFPLHTKIPLVSPFLPLLTQKQGGGYPLKNVGAPTFLIFPLIFRTFSHPRLSIACIQPRGRSRRAGPVEATGAQKTRIKASATSRNAGEKRTHPLQKA